MNETSETITVAPGNGTKGQSRITAKDPATKLAHKRLSVLELAESLRNVSEACQRSRIDQR